MLMDSFLAQFVFWIFAIITVGSAIVVVISRSLIYSAFALLFTFFGVAVLYVFLGADFLAATQMVIYVGGILVLLLFGVMLTHKLYDLKLKTATFQLVPGIVIGLAVLLTLGWVIFQTTWHGGGQRASEPTTAEIGTLFMTDFILPFEVASIFLLIALIGAAMIVRRRTR
jgi:NADH-quinone oxidoreductase subunit J